MVAPEVAAKVEPPPPSSQVRGARRRVPTAHGQSRITNFMPHQSAGMTRGSMKFCCANSCIFAGYNPPDHPPSHSLEREVSSLEDMMSWPHDYNDIVQRVLSPKAIDLLQERLAGDNYSYSTAFSGIDTPGSVTSLKAEFYSFNQFTQFKL